MIFYFTATGNSKFVADKIAEGMGDRVISIPECVNNDRFSFELRDGEALGFVVPVYFFGLPMIVTEFLEKLKITPARDTYTYTVLNCGGMTANADKILGQVYKVDAVFGIETVDNYVPMYKIVNEANIKDRLDKAEREIEVITGHIKEKHTGTFNSCRGKMSRFTTFMVYPIYKRGRKTAKFSVGASCSDCGLCERICPRKAIELKNGRPNWVKPQCELCLACLHRCPAAAINYGKKSAKNGRYVNPRVKF